MSVIAPPESPPEVQRPYDQWSAPDAPRVSTYRRWTRAQQAGLAAVVAVCVLAGALAGVEWGSTGPWAALQFVILVVVVGTVETLIERDGVRRALACAEPLSDNAIEVTTGPLEALTERRRLLGHDRAAGGADRASPPAQGRRARRRPHADGGRPRC